MARNGSLQRQTYTQEPAFGDVKHFRKATPVLHGNSLARGPIREVSQRLSGRPTGGPSHQ